MNPLSLIEQYDQKIAAGIGTGQKEHYVPYLTIWNTSSRANRSLLWSSRLQRNVHLLSHGEVLAYLQFDWMRQVTDIREQIPLDPRVTLEICRDFHVQHPGYTFGGCVMTSDFVVTCRTPHGFVDHAYQIKRSRNDLENRRTYTKLRIEKEYWARKGIEWTLLYSADFPGIRCRNLENLYGWREYRASAEDLQFLLRVFRVWQSDYPDALPHTIPEVIVKRPSGDEITSRDAVLLLCAKQLLRFQIDEVRVDDCPLGEFLEVDHHAG